MVEPMFVTRYVIRHGILLYPCDKESKWQRHSEIEVADGLNLGDFFLPTMIEIIEDDVIIYLEIACTQCIKILQVIQACSQQWVKTHCLI